MITKQVSLNTLPTFGPKRTHILRLVDSHSQLYILQSNDLNSDYIVKDSKSKVVRLDAERLSQILKKRPEIETCTFCGLETNLTRFSHAGCLLKFFSLSTKYFRSVSYILFYQ